jgi:hypothetical protein
MSAQCPLYPQSGHVQCTAHVCYGPKADIGGLLDDLVGASQQCRWNVDSERFGRLQIYDELELSRQLNWHLGWFLAFEDAAGIETSLTKLLRKA